MGVVRQPKLSKHLMRSLLTSAFAAFFTVSGAKAAEQPKSASPVFAKVGDVSVSVDEFERAVRTAARKKFYHGSVPNERMLELRREVGTELVNEVLLEKEAKRRGIKPDAARIKQTLDDLDKRYGQTERWKAQRAETLPAIRKHMERESLIAQLGEQVKRADALTPKEVEAYYVKHPEKFTEPEQLRLSVILLKVEPSSPSAVWDKAREEGAALTKRLRGGANFAELAKIHSNDESAGRGGDMGYIHRGMLAEGAQAALDKAKVGEITDPVTVLQGVAVFRLEDRKTSTLNPLSKVETRARDLAAREKSDGAWNELIAKLRRDTRISIDEGRYTALPGEKGGAASKDASG